MNNSNQDTAAIPNLHHLLWTGGWDSTFRLVQLLEQGITVQPHYLISPDRLSLGAELIAQRNIRQALQNNHPEFYNCLLPMRYGIVTELKRVPEITAAWERLRKRTYLGAQYKFMGWYCANSGIRYFDAGYQNSGGTLYRQLDTYLTPREPGQSYRVMDPKFADREEYILFQFYMFTIWDITKVETQEIAREHGFFDVMKLTWFCHNPLPDMTPCGNCNPCSFVFDEGMSWRMPLKSKIRHYTPSRAMARRFVLRHMDLYRAIRRWQSRQAA